MRLRRARYFIHPMQAGTAAAQKKILRAGFVVGKGRRAEVFGAFAVPVVVADEGGVVEHAHPLERSAGRVGASMLVTTTHRRRKRRTQHKSLEMTVERVNMRSPLRLKFAFPIH